MIESTESTIVTPSHHGPLDFIWQASATAEEGWPGLSRLPERNALAAFMGDSKSGGPVSTIQLRLWHPRAGLTGGRSAASNKSEISTITHARLSACGAVLSRSGPTSIGTIVSATTCGPCDASLASYGARTVICFGSATDGSHPAANVNVSSIVIAIRDALRKSGNVALPTISNVFAQTQPSRRLHARLLGSSTNTRTRYRDKGTLSCRTYASRPSCTIAIRAIVILCALSTHFSSFRLFSPDGPGISAPASNTSPPPLTKSTTTVQIATHNLWRNCLHLGGTRSAKRGRTAWNARASAQTQRTEVEIHTRG